jgi:hypothetical protein
MDLNFVRWVAFAVLIVSIALCYRKGADHSTPAKCAFCSLWIFAMADLAIQFGGHVIH